MYIELWNMNIELWNMKNMFKNQGNNYTENVSQSKIVLIETMTPVKEVHKNPNTES